MKKNGKSFLSLSKINPEQSDDEEEVNGIP